MDEAATPPADDPPWDHASDGVLSLPSGRLIRGRGLRRCQPPTPAPQFGVYLLGAPPPTSTWPQRWVPWPDFRAPRNEAEAARVVAETWERCARQRVEVACAGGLGRTGTFLACLVAYEGLDADRAIAWVRAGYDARAVETLLQRRYVARFARRHAAQDRRQ